MINKRIVQILGSTTLAITARAKELKSSGFDVVNFAAGEPDFDTPDAIKQAAIKAIQDGQTKYTPSTGMPSLKDAISKKFKTDNHLNYTSDQIVVGCGAKHVIFNVIQVLTDEGDEVIIPAPYWVSYPEMVKATGAVAKFVETNAETGLKLTPELLQSAISPRTKMLILNSPSNPTGMVYSKAELSAIAEICVKNKIYVISDEIYEKLLYDVKEYVSIASLGKDIFDLTITVNGVSKTYAMTGWRIGYAAGPKEVMDYMKKFQDHSTSNPTTISQYATLAALNLPSDAVEGMRKQFHARRDLICSLLDKIPQISYIKPQGAFYVFVDFSALGNADAIAKAILNEKYVAMIPGEGFGAPGYIRMSFSTSEERIREGIKRIGDWIKQNS